MFKSKTPMAAIAVTVIGLMIAAPRAQAHCDSLDGPVAKAAQKALETGNVNPALAYAPATAEGEIHAAFEKSRKVRGTRHRCPSPCGPSLHGNGDLLASQRRRRLLHGP